MKLTHLLTWLGVIPFTLSIFLGISHTVIWDLSGRELFSLYSLVILCFMAGTLWGQALIDINGVGRNQVILVSNVITLIACFSYIFLPIPWFLVCGALLYMGVLALESYKWKHNSIVLGEYWQLRIQVTAIVCLHHVVMATLQIGGS